MDDDDDHPMIQCSGEDCLNGEWFHLWCIALDPDSELPEVFFCSDASRVGGSVYCFCKKKRGDEAMVILTYINVNNFPKVHIKFK